MSTGHHEDSFALSACEREWRFGFGKRELEGLCAYVNSNARMHDWKAEAPGVARRFFHICEQHGCIPIQ